MRHRLPRARQKCSRKRMGRLGVETITSWKVRELVSRRGQPRAFPLRQRRRARRLRLLEAFLRRRLLARLAVAAPVARILAEAALHARHLRPLLLRRTPRLLLLVAEVEAGVRTEVSPF